MPCSLGVEQAVGRPNQLFLVHNRTVHQYLHHRLDGSETPIVRCFLQARLNGKINAENVPVTWYLKGRYICNLVYQWTANYPVTPCDSVSLQWTAYILSLHGSLHERTGGHLLYLSYDPSSSCRFEYTPTIPGLTLLTTSGSKHVLHILSHRSFRHHLPPTDGSSLSPSIILGVLSLYDRSSMLPSFLATEAWTPALAHRLVTSHI